MSNSGHHDSSTHLHRSYKIHSSKDFSCSMKFTTEKHWCPVSTFSYFHGKAFLGKPATITFDENKDVSWIKFRLLYDNSFAPALGGACAMGTNTMALIQTCQLQAIMTVPESLSFSAQLTNCNLDTCWHIELSILGLIHLSISIHFSNTFSCSMKFFLGLALGESWLLLAQRQKNAYVHKGMLLWESFP